MKNARNRNLNKFFSNIQESYLDQIKLDNPPDLILSELVRQMVAVTHISAGSLKVKDFAKFKYCSQSDKNTTVIAK